MGDLCGVDARKVQTRHTTSVCALTMASAAIDDINAAFAFEATVTALEAAEEAKLPLRLFEVL